MIDKLPTMCNLMRTGLSHNDAHKYLSVPEYIREFRTIGLVFPRRSGKTTYLRQVHELESSLFITMNTQSANAIRLNHCDHSVITFDGISNHSTHLDRLRGIPTCGMKYTSILIDEFTRMTPKHKDDLHDLISELSVRKMLTQDFYVLMLGT